MKPILAALTLVALAACNTTTQTQTHTAAFQSAPSPVTYVQTYGQPVLPPQTSPAAAQAAARVPGWYQTGNGLPWVVLHSTTFKKTGRPASTYDAIDSAFRYSSSNWRPPHALQLNTEHGSALARLATVDGSTFLAMRRLRVNEVFKVLFYTREPYEKLMTAAIRQSGCTRTGETVFRSSNGSVHGLIAPVSC